MPAQAQMAFDHAGCEQFLEKTFQGLVAYPCFISQISKIAISAMDIAKRSRLNNQKIDSKG
jgi:hypothetical protein